MTTCSKFLTGVAAIAAATFLAGAASANMVTNPGFETGTFSGWNSYGTWNVSNNTNVVHSGTYAAVNSLAVAAGTTPGGYSGLYQNISDPNAAGHAFNASVWIFTAETKDYSKAYFQVQFQSSTGSVLQQDVTSAVIGDQAYTQYSLSNLLAPTGTAVIQVQGVVAEISGLIASSANTGYTAFDDFSLAPVPEPAGVALMAVGIAGLALVSRRRRL